MPAEKNLVIVGVGIKSLSHITREAEATIEQADFVYYLLNEPVLERWIKINSKESLSLSNEYLKNEKRKKAYQEISKIIVNKNPEKKNVCFVCYGHPVFLSAIVSHLVEAAPKNGITLNILPAISALDCLMADLKIDFGSKGFLSIEAHQFLERKRQIEYDLYLIIWQSD